MEGVLVEGGGTLEQGGKPLMLTGPWNELATHSGVHPAYAYMQLG